jgi:polysaccharide pyruvyl transferase WcaK-like protein
MRSWPPGRPRILVTDVWLANAGDGAIALATDRRLRRLAPGAAILHAAYQADLVGGAYPELDLVPPLSGLLGVRPWLPEMSGWGADAGKRLVADADLVLSQGGGFAMEHYGPKERLLSWDLVVERRLPIAFCAQSIGPWRDPAGRAILERVLGAAVAVGLRESESVANVLDLGVRADRVVVAADEAFSLFAAEQPGTAARAGIGCVVSGHPWLRRDGTVIDPRDSLGYLTRLVAHLVGLAPGERVTLLSTQQGLGDADRGLEDDADLAARVVDRLPADAARSIRTVQGYIPPLRFADLAAGFRGLVSMRMHPAIFGLCRGVPTVLVSEAYKATAMFEMLGLGGVVVPWGAPLGEIESKLRRDDPPSLDAARARAAANDEVVRRLLGAFRPPEVTGPRAAREAWRHWRPSALRGARRPRLGRGLG